MRSDLNGFLRKATIRSGYPVVFMLAGLALASCAHPEGRKDLLAFLQDGTTTKNELRRGLGLHPFGALAAFGPTGSEKRLRDYVYLRRRAVGWTPAAAWCWSSNTMASCVAMH